MDNWRGTTPDLKELLSRQKIPGECHGIWPWIIALAHWYSASDHHFAGNFHASLAGVI
jgi:hypothetical protein